MAIFKLKFNLADANDTYIRPIGMRLESSAPEPRNVKNKRLGRLL